MQLHDAVIANARVSARMLELNSPDRVLLLASVSSGQGNNTLFDRALVRCIVVAILGAEKRRSRACRLRRRECNHGVRVVAIDLPPYGDDDPTGSPFPNRSLRAPGSESATQQDFRIFERHFSDRCTLNYALSSSETGAISCLALRPGDDVGEGALPVGRLFDGVTVELLDDTGRPVRHGEPGQLVVTSRSVTAGYWRNPELTAERCSSPGGCAPSNVSHARRGPVERGGPA